jgi:hypothetical protein
MQSIPPEAQLFQMSTGFVVSQAIYAAARLGIADHLAQMPQNVDALAAATGAHPDALYRLLRALASIGIFAETTARTFTLTPMAELLRKDHPACLRAVALMMGGHQYLAWSELLYSIQTGRPAFEKVVGKPVFEYLSQNPEAGQIFDQAMTGIHGGETRPMIEAGNFPSFETIIDIGGGNGSTLLEVLRAAPQTRGIVFDLPPVVERTRGLIEQAGLAHRCTAEGGSFFESVPKAGPRDAYLLRHIIHDWDDEKSVAILRTCRAAAHPGAKILVIESVIPPGNEPHPGKWLDLIMLVTPAGRERTAEEFQRLFGEAGIEFTRIVPTASPVSIIEGTVKA